MERQIEIIARGVLIRSSQILLCQNTRHGYWYLPGGHVEFGEAAAAALQREFLEECGLRIQPASCGLVTETAFTAKRPHHELNLVFHVALEGEAPDSIRALEPEIDIRWFDLASIVDLDLRPNSIKAWLVAGGQGGDCLWFSEVPEL